MVGEQIPVEQVELHLPEQLQAALEPVRILHNTLLAELGDPDGVLHATLSKRLAASDPSIRLGVAPSLLTDPSRSGVNVARWQIQSGSMPEAVSGTPEAVLSLWSGTKRGLAPLRLPEGRDEGMMKLADRMSMRGGGPYIYSREELKPLRIDDETTIHIHGGARNANRERAKTALELLRFNPDYTKPVIATGDFARQLNDVEREAVRGFAPDAETELELLLASAIDVGFVPTARLPKIFPDGSVLYSVLTHPDTAAPLYVVAPQHEQDERGKSKTGVHNAYRTLEQNPALGGLGKNIVAVTSTHYGPMALVNNFNASRDLSLEPTSIRVIGDNQPGRTAQAHLIEAGITVVAMEDMYADPALRAALVA